MRYYAQRKLPILLMCWTVMNNPLMFPYSNILTLEETKARDIMVYSFVPVLKMLLNQFNPKEFYQYGYNSCRQTAILGGYFLRSLLQYHLTFYFFLSISHLLCLVLHCNYNQLFLKLPFLLDHFPNYL